MPKKRKVRRGNREGGVYIAGNLTVGGNMYPRDKVVSIGGNIKRGPFTAEEQAQVDEAKRAAEDLAREVREATEAAINAAKSGEGTRTRGGITVPGDFVGRHRVTIHIHRRGKED